MVSAGRPRVIRKVVKFGVDKRPKVARDRRTQIQMTRVRAAVSHTCQFWNCPHGGKITAGTEYAQVVRPDDTKTVGWRQFTDPKPFHFECVPPEARPLVRFFQ